MPSQMRSYTKRPPADSRSLTTRAARRLWRIFAAASLLATLSSVASGQTSGVSGRTPPGVAPGAPAGSYGLGGFDNVNLYSGNLNFQLPLLKIGGRGGAGASINLNINSVKWTMEHEKFSVESRSEPPSMRLREPSARVSPEDYYLKIAYMSEFFCAHPLVDCMRPITHPQQPSGIAQPPKLDPAPMLESGEGVFSHSYPSPVWWGDLRVGYGPGVMMGRWMGTSGERFTSLNTTLTRLTFSAPDGTEYELHDVLHHGEPIQHAVNEPVSRGTVFATADGSSMTFISDQEIRDNFYATARFILHPSGYLYMA